MGKLNSYTSIELRVSMSYDSRNIINRFLQLNRLNSSINHLPTVIEPFQMYPPSLIQKNRNRLASGGIVNKIPDLPSPSSMGTELLDDLGIRQEEFLKKIRKYPQNLRMYNSQHETEK
jgi:hypothetical protein